MPSALSHSYNRLLPFRERKCIALGVATKRLRSKGRLCSTGMTDVIVEGIPKVGVRVVREMPCRSVTGVLSNPTVEAGALVRYKERSFTAKDNRINFGFLACSVSSMLLCFRMPTLA
jgi:hypothetical protein